MKIDLSKLPEGTKWIAIDEDGEVYSYGEEPRRLMCDNEYFYAGSSIKALRFLGNALD